MEIKRNEIWNNFSPIFKIILLLIMGFILMEFILFLYEVVAYDLGQLIYRWLLKPFV